DVLGDPESGGGVLHVGNHQVGAVVVDESPQPPSQQLASGASDDVSDEEQLHCAPPRVTAMRWAWPRRSRSLGSTTMSSPSRTVAVARGMSKAPVRRTARAKRPNSRSTRW